MIRKTKIENYNVGLRLVDGLKDWMGTELARNLFKCHRCFFYARISSHYKRFSFARKKLCQIVTITRVNSRLNLLFGLAL